VNSSSLQKPVPAVRVVADQQVLQHRRVLEQLDVLEGPGDAHLGHAVGRHVRQVVALERDGPGGGHVDPADQVEHRGLAGTVGADQGEDLALSGRRKTPC
jgi:hypothetical protein